MKRFTRQLILIVTAGLLLTGFSTSFSTTSPDPTRVSATNLKPLVIGIFPRRNATNTMKMFLPLSDYLGRQLGRPVKLVTAHDFPAFWDGVVKQRYDIVHYNQLHYIQSNKNYGYQVILANEEFGVKTICGVIMVRTDAGIDKLSDLKDKRIIFGGGRKAMISYVATTALLRDAGLQDGDYHELFAKNPPNASLAAYHHQSDAAGVGSPVLKMPSIKAAIDTSKIKFLAESKPLVHLPWAVNKRLGKEMARKVTRAMLDLNNTEQGHKILTSAKLTGLYKVTDKDFNPHRRLIEKINQ